MAMMLLISQLRKLGFSINWRKIVDTTQVLVFTGIGIDTVKLELRLTKDKLMHLKEDLASFMQCRRAYKRLLQSLVGKLNLFHQLSIKHIKLLLHPLYGQILNVDILLCLHLIVTS